MRANKIKIKQVVLTPDGLGGKIETHKDIEIYGKLFFKKDTKVVTRAYDTLTQKATNMYVLYANTFYNDFNLLMAIKKGDRLDTSYGNYKVDLIEAHNTKFTITFSEESKLND